MTFDDVLKANGFSFDRVLGPLKFFKLHKIRAAIAASPHSDPHLSIAAYTCRHQTRAKVVGHWRDPRVAAIELPHLLYRLAAAEASEDGQYLAS